MLWLVEAVVVAVALPVAEAAGIRVRRQRLVALRPSAGPRHHRLARPLRQLARPLHRHDQVSLALRGREPPQLARVPPKVNCRAFST